VDQIGSTGLGIWVALFVVVWAVLWLLLPFAIFGTKARLDRLIELTISQNKLLKDLLAEYRGPEAKSAEAPGARRGFLG
jgi:hypothetical protein